MLRQLVKVINRTRSNPIQSLAEQIFLSFWLAELPEAVGVLESWFYYLKGENMTFQERILIFEAVQEKVLLRTDYRTEKEKWRIESQKLKIQNFIYYRVRKPYV